MFFHLKGECYLVKGKSGSAIYNLITKEIISLNDEETSILLKAELGEESEESAILKELHEMGWGIFSDKKLFIDKIRPYNEFLLMRLDLKSPVLQTAYLQLTDRCDFSTAHCSKMFCTPCRTNECGRAELSAAGWRDIIDKLCLAGVQSIILTGGDVSVYADLNEVIQKCLSKGLWCTVVLNHFKSEVVESLPDGVKVLVYACQKEHAGDYKRIIEKRPDASIILNEQMQYLQTEISEQGKGKLIHTKTYEIHVDEKSIINCGIDQFFGKKDNNTCLNGKMYILCDGCVVPCYQKRDVILGSLDQEHFSNVYRRLVEQYWNKPNKYKKCMSCQWYYGCSVCMNMEPDKQCGYDGELDIWKA